MVRFLFSSIRSIIFLLRRCLHLFMYLCVEKRELLLAIIPCILLNALPMHGLFGMFLYAVKEKVDGFDSLRNGYVRPLERFALPIA